MRNIRLYLFASLRHSFTNRMNFVRYFTSTKWLTSLHDQVQHSLRQQIGTTSWISSCSAVYILGNSLRASSPGQASSSGQASSLLRCSSRLKKNPSYHLYTRHRIALTVGIRTEELLVILTRGPQPRLPLGESRHVPEDFPLRQEGTTQIPCT